MELVPRSWSAGDEVVQVQAHHRLDQPGLEEAPFPRVSQVELMKAHDSRPRGLSARVACRGLRSRPELALRSTASSPQMLLQWRLRFDVQLSFVPLRFRTACNTVTVSPHLLTESVLALESTCTSRLDCTSQSKERHFCRCFFNRVCGASSCGWKWNRIAKVEA